MDLVVRRISEHTTVSARVRHRAEMFDQKLVGSGVYLQSRQGQRLQARFSLSVKTADRMVNLLHVCDGRTLWMFDNLDGREKLSRVDLLRLRQSSGGQGGTLMPIMLGGGLPQLLGSLQQNFIASQPQSIVFQQVPVWAIALRWNPERLARLLGKTDLFDDQGQAADRSFARALSGPSFSVGWTGRLVPLSPGFPSLDFQRRVIQRDGEQEVGIPFFDDDGVV